MRECIDMLEKGVSLFVVRLQGFAIVEAALRGTATLSSIGLGFCKIEAHPNPYNLNLKTL
jgi:hypothetical protein